MNHCDKLLQSPDAEPELYWDNTSSNEIIKRFIENADMAVRSDIERLIAGEVLEKRLVLNLTYQELDKKELLWSAMYQTGYLTLDHSSKSKQRGVARFIIPNREIKEIFMEKIREWFAEKIVPGHQIGLYDEIWNCKAEELQHRIRDILYDTISCHDYHENYYHTLMVGLLLNGEYDVRSNYEMGGGRSDIAIIDQRGSRAVIIETRRSKNYDDLEKGSEEALEQLNKEFSHSTPLWIK